MASFIFGITLPFRAALLILKNPKLFLLSLLPVGLSIALYTLLIFKAIEYSHSWVHSLSQTFHFSAGGWLGTVLLILTQLTVGVGVLFSFASVTTLCSVPFNDFLAEATERYTGLALTPSPNLKLRLKLIRIDFVKSTAATIVSLLALIFAWLPVIHLFAFLLTAFLFTLQFISFPQTRREEGFFSGLRFIKNHLGSSLGFGLSCMILFAIPFFSFAVIPIAVVAGTLLYAEEVKRELLRTPTPL